MFLKSLTLSNILSFGPEPHTVELGPLNVIIGPNGSGKSNFIEAIGLLKAAPRDIREPIREGGGVVGWLWKGEGRTAVAKLEAVVTDPITADETNPAHRDILAYRLSFRESNQRFDIQTEDFSVLTHEESPRRLPYFEIKNGRVRRDGFDEKDLNRRIDLDREASLLTQLAPPFNDSEIFSFSTFLKSIQIIRDIDTGRDASLRKPQRVDAPNLHLSQKGENLALVINRLRTDIASKQAISFYIRELFEGAKDVDVQIEGGTVQVFIDEGTWMTPMVRLSSGTLRFLCLIAVLCHPDPPPLICIEEPELGLHPDLIPTISKLLKEASERTQLIVTTHSDILVDTLTDRPGAVLVAERREDGTRLTRLDAVQLKPWLEDYRLGQLWTRGDLGGTRW